MFKRNLMMYIGRVIIELARGHFVCDQRNFLALVHIHLYHIVFTINVLLYYYGSSKSLAAL